MAARCRDGTAVSRGRCFGRKTVEGGRTRPGLCLLVPVVALSLATCERQPAATVSDFGAPWTTEPEFEFGEGVGGRCQLRPHQRGACPGRRRSRPRRGSRLGAGDHLDARWFAGARRGKTRGGAGRVCGHVRRPGAPRGVFRN